MSIFSQKTSSARSSILKRPPSLSSKLSQLSNTQQKVRFTLPHAKRVQNILSEYIETKSSRDYENLLVLLRDSELTDHDLTSLLDESTECISILNHDLRLFIEGILYVRWTDRSKQVVKQYQSFIVNLLCAHNYHAKIVIDKLVSLFLPAANDPEWIDGVPLDSDCEKCAHIHSLFNVLITVIPMSKDLLVSALKHNFPYHTKSTHIHEYYLHNLLWTLEYAPEFRPAILNLIFSKLIIMDVNAPKEDIEKAKNEDEEIFSMEDFASVKSSNVNCHVVGHTLDVCLDRMFNYVIQECHTDEGELIWEKCKGMYLDILTVFDTVILPTYDTHHVQFIMFILCSFKPTITEAFLNYLWKKVCNPAEASVIRQAAVNYIASLIARANYVSLKMLNTTLQHLANWIHSYIGNQDGLDTVNSDVRVHSVFYSVCQALFYVIVFRNKDLIRTKKDIVFLESFNLGKIVTCRLNPLRVCQPAVVQNFAAVTRKYQLAYCYSIIEHNARNTIPTIYQDEKGASVMSNNILDTFYPFDPFILERSSKKINLLYSEFQEKKKKHNTSISGDMEVVEDVDDFLYQENAQKFSYGASPGFKLKG